MYYVYILRIEKTGRYYIGQTQNLVKRLDKHSKGKTKSMKNRGEFEVVHVEKCSSRAQAMKRERQIKSYKGGEAFKRLLSDFAEKGRSAVELYDARFPHSLTLKDLISRHWRDTPGSLRLV